jgi:hypothetical protein
MLLHCCQKLLYALRSGKLALRLVSIVSDAEMWVLVLVPTSTDLLATCTSKENNHVDIDLVRSPKMERLRVSNAVRSKGVGNQGNAKP